MRLIDVNTLWWLRPDIPFNKMTTTTTTIDRSHVKWIKKAHYNRIIVALDLIRFHVNVSLIAYKK